MNSLAKSLLLFGALILLVFGIVCLKQRLGPRATPPAFIPSEPLATPGSGSGQRPTVLSADPHSETAMPMNPRFEVAPLPEDDSGLASPTVPVNTFAPESPPTAGAPANQDSAATLPPISESGATGLLAATVVTRENDSWWAISERVYGRGDRFKELFLHNRDLVEQPDRIPAGIELQVAEIQP